MSPVTTAAANSMTLPLEVRALPDAEPSGLSRESVEVQQWLDQARTGDQAAFGRLIDLHQRVVVRTAMAALGSREDAEDAAQEAFLLAWRKLDGFRGESSFKTWLITIVWRKALDRRRSRLTWWKRVLPHQEQTDPFGTVAGSEPSPEQSALARETARNARREIGRLSPVLRDTLLLAASGEYTYEEIAAMLGAPLGTIKWRVSEARRLVSSRMRS